MQSFARTRCPGVWVERTTSLLFVGRRVRALVHARQKARMTETRAHLPCCDSQALKGSRMHPLPPAYPQNRVSAQLRLVLQNGKRNLPQSFSKSFTGYATILFMPDNQDRIRKLPFHRKSPFTKLENRVHPIHSREGDKRGSIHSRGGV